MAGNINNDAATCACADASQNVYGTFRGNATTSVDMGSSVYKVDILYSSSGATKLLETFDCGYTTPVYVGTGPGLLKWTDGTFSYGQGWCIIGDCTLKEQSNGKWSYTWTLNSRIETGLMDFTPSPCDCPNNVNQRTSFE